jgi:hypothetical protein
VQVIPNGVDTVFFRPPEQRPAGLFTFLFVGRFQPQKNLKVVISAVAGRTSIVAPVYFLGGIQLMFLGVIGAYIGKIYLEMKSRPRFLVRTTINVKTRIETLGRDPR